MNIFIIVENDDVGRPKLESDDGAVFSPPLAKPGSDG